MISYLHPHLFVSCWGIDYVFRLDTPDSWKQIFKSSRARNVGDPTTKWVDILNRCNPVPVDG